jgi:hypothetical protein
MKKLIAYLIIFLLVATPTWSFAATYYAQKAGNINADDVWFDAPSGGSGVTGATALAGTHTLYANTFAITVNVSFTAEVISTAAGAGTAGGSFAVATNASPLTVTAVVEAGTSACLVVSGNAEGNPVFTLAGSATGGSAAAAYGVSTSHTVGNIVINNGTSNVLIGGTNATAYGLYISGVSPVSVTGNVLGANAPGIYNNITGSVILVGNASGGGVAGGYGIHNNASGALNITGNVNAGSTVRTYGIYSISTGAITIAGNIVNSTTSMAYVGVQPTWTGATNYIQWGTTKYYYDIPDAANVLPSDTVAGVTGTASSGGGSYAF